ncbi:hypothetical protein C5167_020224 [Papaver somniferum]|uniref:SKP1-like protein n=1 Tax=Papaver somniferum TaxID=3469 RepID=A0A4Y7IVJ6_PAPSO|nr:hypothetical protein C5167_020224 [Papaver somniferum]
MADTKKMVTLMSCDGETFEVEEAVALQSGTIKHMIEDGCADNAIPIPNITSNILAKVIEYCKKHAEETPQGDARRRYTVEEDLKNWDAEFIIKVNDYILFDLILAANYLNIKDLLELTTQKVADTIKGKTPEQIRKYFYIKKDFTPEEEAEIMKEKITLKSCDGEIFDVDEAVALQSRTIKHIIEDGCADNAIPLPNVKSQTLAKVIAYCKKHVETSEGNGRREDLDKWDAVFVKVGQYTLFEYILAANYLDIKSKYFNIKNDFTPEEEEEEVRNKAF